MASVFGSGAEFIIRSYLNKVATLDVVGLYNAAYMITTVYAGMAFSSLETDYFPRLSVANSSVGERNVVVNRQIEVLLLIISPMIVALIVGLPIIIPLLYSSAFTPAVAMIQVSMTAMYLRAVVVPLAYVNLAVGRSRAYMALEGLSAVFIVLFTVVGYSRLGLVGAGVAMLLSQAADLIVTYVYVHRRFRYRISAAVIKYLSLHAVFGIAALTLAFCVSNPYVYWTVGVLLTLASAYCSIRILQRKTRLWTKLTAQFKRKRG